MARKPSQPNMDHLPVEQSDGRWHYYWMQEGKRRHVSGATQMECIMTYSKRYQDIEAGLVDINQNTPVREWARTWLDTYKATKGLTSKSLGMYKEKLNGYILPAIGSRSLSTVTELHLQQILNNSTGMSESHLKKLRLVLREMFGKAYDLGYTKRNPAGGLELPEGTSNERRSLTPLEREAFERITSEGLHRGCLFYRVMLLCGLRPGECAALEWRHIDFGRSIIRVEQAKESGSSTIKDPKTDSGFREVPVRPDLLEELRAARGLPAAPVFIREHGGRHTDTSLRAMWTSWKRLMDRTMAVILVERARAAGSELEAERILSNLDGDFSPTELATEVCSDRYKGPVRTVTYRNRLVLHGEPEELLNSLVAYDLRHTYCTDLQKAGVDLKTASYLMGHKDITTTANIYSHTDTELVQAAAEKIRAYAGL